jgi:hypothetical protein
LVSELKKGFKFGSALLIGLCSGNVEFLSVFELGSKLLSLAAFSDGFALVTFVAHGFYGRERRRNKNSLMRKFMFIIL